MPDPASAFAAPTEQPAATPAAQPTNPSSAFADQLATIKNEDGAQKYDTLEKALEGLGHAQSYIPQLKSDLATKEAELVQLRAEASARASVEDVVSRLSQPAAPEAPAAIPAAPAPGLSEADIAALVQKNIAHATAQTAAQTNARSVDDALIKMYGDKANATVHAKAAELGTTAAELQKLASQSPAMVMALFNQGSTPAVSVTAGSFNVEPRQPEVTPVTRPEKSILSGATASEQKAHLLDVKAEVYRKLGVEI